MADPGFHTGVVQKSYFLENKSWNKKKDHQNSFKTLHLNWKFTDKFDSRGARKKIFDYFLNFRMDFSSKYSKNYEICVKIRGHVNKD